MSTAQQAKQQRKRALGGQSETKLIGCLLLA